MMKVIDILKGIAHQIEPFRGDSGAWCKPQPIEDGGVFWLPLGWEDELTARGIEFEVIEIGLDGNGN
jgi:hypothetical protein